MEEVRSMKAMKPFWAKVYTLSGSSMVMLLESFDTANDLKIAIIKKLKISVNKFPLFGLYEVFEDEYYEERYIEENELIMDLISSWRSSTVGSFKLLIKIRYFIYQGAKDQILPFVYMQSVFDVLRGITMVPSKIIPVLAALKLSLDKGKSKVLDGYLSTNLGFYIPGPYLKNQPTSGEEWIDRILKKYNQLPELSKQQAQAKYIEMVMNSGLYGSSIFYINFQEASGSYTLPKEVMVGVSYEKIAIYSRDHRRKLMELEYSEINSWGVSNDRLALVFAKNGYQVQYLFETAQGRVIANLMQGYVNFRLGKPLTSPAENDSKARTLGLSRDLAIKFPCLCMELFH